MGSGPCGRSCALNHPTACMFAFLPGLPVLLDLPGRPGGFVMEKRCMGSDRTVCMFACLTGLPDSLRAHWTSKGRQAGRRQAGRQSNHLKIVLHVCLYVHGHLAYQVSGCPAAPVAVDDTVRH